jgi:hypothetical protein
VLINVKNQTLEMTTPALIKLSRSEQKKLKQKFDVFLKRFDVAFGKGEVADMVSMWTDVCEVDMNSVHARRLKFGLMQQINQTKRRYHRVNDAQLLFEAFEQLCPDLPDTVTNMDNLVDPPYMILHVAKRQRVDVHPVHVVPAAPAAPAADTK